MFFAHHVLRIKAEHLDIFWGYSKNP